MMFRERLRPLRPLKAQIFSFPSLKIIIRVRAALGTAPISGASSLRCCDWLAARETENTFQTVGVPSCFYGKCETPCVSVDWKHGVVSCVSCTRHVFSFTCIVHFLFSSVLWPVIENVLKKKKRKKKSLHVMWSLSLDKGGGTSVRRCLTSWRTECALITSLLV